IALALTLLVTLSANKCKNAPAEMTSLLDKKWIFQSIAGEALKMPAGAELPWLQLAGDQLQGFGGCNQLMGGYKMDGTALSFSDIGSTKKYCEGVQPTENAITGLLRQVDGYKMEGGLLKLLGAGKELAALKGQ
ncbi:MAG: META domain-containing protein, partial [Flavobacteriales bacterium]